MLEFFSILAVGLAGGAVPLLFRWSDRQFHAALALSSGVFLGAVFLHLLPMVGAVAGTAHADLVFGPARAGTQLGTNWMHDHDGDGVPDHLAAAPDSLRAPKTPSKSNLGAPALDGALTDPIADPAADLATDPATGASTGSALGHSHSSNHAWLWVLLGVVGVYFVEALLVPGHHHHPHQAGCAAPPAEHLHAPQPHEQHGHTHSSPATHASHSHVTQGVQGFPAADERRENQRHRAVGWAALVGLSVHSLTSGVALAAVAEDKAIASVMLFAILAHKGFESFSLASVFAMSARDRRHVFALVVAFSLVTPLGLLLGRQVTALFGTGGIGVLTALAAGTFLYVCIGELLPEVFHHREDVFAKISLLSLGVGIMYAVHAIGGA